MTENMMTMKLDGLEMKLSQKLVKTDFKSILDKMNELELKENIVKIKKLFITGYENNYQVEIKYKTPRSNETKNYSLEEFYNL